MPISYYSAELEIFIKTGQPGYFKESGVYPAGFDDPELKAQMNKFDVFELWRLLSRLPKTYEDVWRGWFLPTALGHLASAP